ncbi:hypothetical protein HZ326_26249 [Fusarium oxysporum f. sp. albedinis]|nr:hypothetical protein HZ326_26249 [Fusarium oxysporum f. sp. albedinis]
MEAIAGPAEESEWTLEDINMSHGDRLRYVAMPNDEYAAFLEWRESQKEQVSTTLEMLVGTMIVATSLLSFALLYLYGMEVDITIASFALCLKNTVSDG